MTTTPPMLDREPLAGAAPAPPTTSGGTGDGTGRPTRSAPPDGASPPSPMARPGPAAATRPMPRSPEPSPPPPPPSSRPLPAPQAAQPSTAFEPSWSTRPAALDAAGSAAPRFGPYELKTLLGRSAATMTWLADDPRSGFAAVVCMPRVRPAGAAARQAWLYDARRAARIDHPRVAAAFDIGLHDQWPYLAFDRRHDRTLDEWRALHAAATPAEHVALAVEALEGLAFAHEAGAVHRDLQPHHWWVDSHGHVRLMAFDVATALPDGGTAHAPGAADGADAAGSSPGRATAQPPRAVAEAEAAALHDRRGDATRDVLAVALILHGLLAGRPALDEADIGRVHRRLPPAGRDVVRLPRATPQPVPEPLRAIVDRATARDPRQRYLNARSLLAALDGWRRGDSGDAAAPMAALLERVRTVGALPALPDADSRAAQLFGREGERTGALAEHVLREPGLALELLRQANSAHAQGQRAAVGEPVVTVSRAIGLLGLDRVRRAAAALRRWPGPAGEAHATALERLLRRVHRAGLVAQALRPAGYDAELVYIVTLLQNLGRLIVQYHRPEEAEQVRALMHMAATEDPSPLRPAMLGESAATYAVLGFDGSALADAVVRPWGLGDDLAWAMRRIDPAQPVGTITGDWARLRASASAANEAVDAMNPPTAAARSVKAETAALLPVVNRYGPALRIGIGALRDALREAAEAMGEE